MCIRDRIIAGYDRFLSKWGFRKAFPTAESVFLACGLTEYQSWQNYMENARLSDDLDFAAISGWESTAIENHSGIVDNLRNFKSDPKLIAGSLRPVRPIAKQHSMCVGPDDPFVFDLFLANDTGKPVTGELIFSVIDPKNRITEVGDSPIEPMFVGDFFRYQVAELVGGLCRNRVASNFGDAVLGIDDTEDQLARDRFASVIRKE